MEHNDQGDSSGYDWDSDLTYTVVSPRRLGLNETPSILSFHPRLAVVFHQTPWSLALDRNHANVGQYPQIALAVQR